MAKTAGGIVTLLGDPDSTRSDKFYCYRARAEFARGQGSRVAGDRGGTVKLAHVRRLFATAVDVWIKQVKRDLQFTSSKRKDLDLIIRAPEFPCECLMKGPCYLGTADAFSRGLCINSIAGKYRKDNRSKD